MNIPIYNAEIEDGIAQKIESSASIAYISEAKFGNKLECKIDELSHPELAKANNDQWDLFWMNSVLVSTGWNLNDDVFDPAETWAARNSPIHKKFNFQHNERDIIGHMTASLVMLPDGNLFDKGEVPDKYDIIVASVLYKHWSDPDLQERMDNIIKGISEGKWFVSMECLFKNFDYAVVTPEGENKVIARNKDSAFLTKHLRVYGGTGEYEGNKLGRFLRNFTYSGKGLVENPGNPRSIIFKDVNLFNKSQSNLSLTKKGTFNMAENQELVVSQLKESLAQANARTEKLEKNLDTLVAEARKAEKESFEKQIAGLKVDVEDLEKKIETKSEELKKQEQTVSDLQKELKETKNVLKDAQDKVDASQKEALKSNRMSALIAVGLDSTKAEELVTKWLTVSDEQFSDIVELQKATMDMSDEEKKKMQKNMDKKTKDKTKDAKAGADVDLENADVDSEGNLAVGNENEVKELQESAQAWVASFLKTTKKNQE